MSTPFVLFLLNIYVYNTNTFLKSIFFVIFNNILFFRYLPILDFLFHILRKIGTYIDFFLLQ
jgi:hypothetical protein